MIALCNSCLRIRHFDTDEEACESDCVCGATGELYGNADAYCSCPSCQHDAKLLLGGQRVGISGISDHVNLDGWTADDGVAA